MSTETVKADRTVRGTDPEFVKTIVKRHPGKRGALLGVLEEIQARLGYLPEEVLRTVAEQMKIPLVDVYGVATFYRAFGLRPRGKHLVLACQGTACHVRGARRVAEEFERQLGVKAGHTTADNEFTLETVNCLGACALGPMVVVDGHYFSHVSPRKVKQILDESRNGFEQDVGDDPRIFPLETCCPNCNHRLTDPNHLIDGRPSIHLTVAFRQKHGWLRLSSLYGSYTVETEHEIPEDAVVDVFCPHCHAALGGASDCPVCGTQMVSMIVRGGGVVQVCSRRGCQGHMLDLR